MLHNDVALWSLEYRVVTLWAISGDGMKIYMWRFFFSDSYSIRLFLKRGGPIGGPQSQTNIPK